MKLSQLTESFVISNDEFEDYLNRTTEQLAQELQTGKNARDAIHDLALTFAAQHNKSYDAYMRMSDALTARMHTLELDGSASTDIVPADTMNEPMADMGDEMGDDEPEMMTDPMGDMEMDTPADDEMPSDSDMDDYAAVMDNEPEAEEMGESVVNEASCGCCGNDPCDCGDDCDCKSVDEGIKDTVKAAGKKIGKAAKKAKKFIGHGEHPAFGEFDDDEFEESVSEGAMDTINQIVADKQAGKLHGMTVDMFTASAIKQIYDVVNDNNKAKLDDLMSSKEGVLKAANMAMKMMKEGKMNEFAPIAAVAGGVGRALGGAAGMSNKLGKAANALGKANNALGMARKVGGKVGAATQLGKGAYNLVKNQFNRAGGKIESKADEIMRSSTRASFSEYNEFYKELDKAAKAGKKAGDTIKVGGKNIKLKSNPKQMHQLTDSDMNAIDALAEKCKSHRK